MKPTLLPYRTRVSTLNWIPQWISCKLPISGARPVRQCIPGDAGFTAYTGDSLGILPLIAE